MRAAAADADAARLGPRYCCYEHKVLCTTSPLEQLVGDMIVQLYLTVAVVRIDPCPGSGTHPDAAFRRPMLNAKVR